MTLSVELDREDDGRWLAEVPALAGVMCYGTSRDEAVARVQALALRVIAERLERREAPAEFLNVTFQTLARPNWPDFVFAFHDDDEIGPKMLSRIAKRTGLTPDDL